VVETPEPHIAPVIDIMESLKKSLEIRKPSTVAHAAAGETEASAEETAKPKRTRKAKSA
jgi:hypothetical protein